MPSVPELCQPRGRGCPRLTWDAQKNRDFDLKSQGGDHLAKGVKEMKEEAILG